jgi:hypothetical protein
MCKLRPGQGALLLFLSALALFGANTRALAQESNQELNFRPEVSYQAENLRDPFKNPIQEEAAAAAKDIGNVPELVPPKLTIQGVIWGGLFPQAIINNQVVKVGGNVEGAQIISIDKDSVTVYFGNRNIVLPSPASDNLSSSSTQAKQGGK